jgi:hypothetical protein
VGLRQCAHGRGGGGGGGGGGHEAAPLRPMRRKRRTAARGAAAQHDGGARWRGAMGVAAERCGRAGERRPSRRGPLSKRKRMQQ